MFWDISVKLVEIITAVMINMKLDSYKSPSAATLVKTLFYQKEHCKGNSEGLDLSRIAWIILNDNYALKVKTKSTYYGLMF